MNRNEVTSIDRLQIGDRFYKSSDKAKVKEVYQVMDPEKQIRTKSQKHFACPVGFLGLNCEASKTVPLNENTMVVFLRSPNSK